MPTLTTNYDFQLPVEGADDDVWGGFLNNNWTALDTRLFSGTIGADTTGNAATATLATSATAATLAADATKLAAARTLTIGDTGKTFDGSANVTWTLGEVGVTLASQGEAEAGTNNSKFMTPLRTAEAIAALVPASNELTEAEVTNNASTVFGQVSGQRLSQAVLVHETPDSVKAWVNFSGSGPVFIRTAKNVSSITDLGTGQFRLNFTTAMNTVNYAWSGAARSTNSTTTTRATVSAKVNGFKSDWALDVLVTSGENATAPTDSSEVCVAVFA